MEINTWFQQIKDWASSNPGKVVGMLAGAIIFLVLMVFGPLLLLFLLLVGGGFIIGKSIDDNISIQELIRKWLSHDARNSQKKR